VRSGGFAEAGHPDSLTVDLPAPSDLERKIGKAACESDGRQGSLNLDLPDQSGLRLEPGKKDCYDLEHWPKQMLELLAVPTESQKYEAVEVFRNDFPVDLYYRPREHS
jgi:hypothetical protein